MKVGIIGAGAIAHGMSALLKERGHTAYLWSPSGKDRPGKVQISGMIDTSHTVDFVHSPEQLTYNSEVLIFALPANGHKATMDDIAPFVRRSHQIIISSHLSFGAVYLNDLISAGGFSVPVYAWNTTPVTSKQIDPHHYHVSTIRKSVSVFQLPVQQFRSTSSVCSRLFPNEFVFEEGLLDITFSNLNPQIHMAMALCNMTRMEQGEAWCQRQNVTPSVGRLIEALDNERLSVARAYGRHPKSMFDIYKSSGFSGNSIHEVNQLLHTQRTVWGPKTEKTRYVTEDAPYGLWVTAKLGVKVGVPTPLHLSGVDIFSALYGRDFRSENEILESVDPESYLGTSPPHFAV